MPEWVPKRAQVADWAALNLSAVDGFVLSHIDGATPVQVLAERTGMPLADVERVLGKLERSGVLEPRQSAPAGAPRPASPEAAEPPPEAPEEEEVPPPSAQELAATGTHRKLFETTLHALTADERASLAARAVEPELSALCFDPLPEVVKQVLHNPSAGLAHARLVAAHHPNPVGLEAIAARGAFFQERQVQQLLLRNPQTPVPLIRRVLGVRRLLEIFKAGSSRDLPEKNRHVAREVLRTRFGPASAEEKVELIVATEGRCLTALSGLALDGKAVAMLCARSYASVQLITNLGHWAATPPALVAHLLKQPLARRMPQLRNLLLRHPNRPSSAT